MSLLMLNGTGSPMSQWDPALLAALSRDRQVVVYDYPGLGGSAPLRAGSASTPSPPMHAG